MMQCRVSFNKELTFCKQGMLSFFNIPCLQKVSTVDAAILWKMFWNISFYLALKFSKYGSKTKMADAHSELHLRG